VYVHVCVASRARSSRRGTALQAQPIGDGPNGDLAAADAPPNDGAENDDQASVAALAGASVAPLWKQVGWAHWSGRPNGLYIYI
jgi:hypothetical protein